MNRHFRQIKFDSEAKAALMEGVAEVAKAVSITLGPRGSTVVIQDPTNPWLPPKTTKDGVTVAKSIDYKDNYKSMGAKLAISASAKTVDEEGDGTTTSMILTHAIASNGVNALEGSTMSPFELAREIQYQAEAVCQKLDSYAIQVKDDWEKLHQVAMISTNGDKVLSDLIISGFKQVGVNGLVNVMLGKGVDSELILKDGMRVNRGWKSNFFVNNPKQMTCEFEKAFVVVTDNRLASVDELIPAFEQMQKQGRPVIVVCKEITGEALSLMAVNARKLNQQGNQFSMCAVEVGGNMDLLGDIAAFTGATVIAQETGIELKNFKIDEHAGICDVHVSNKETILKGGNQNTISPRVVQIQGLLEDEEGPIEKQNLEERIARLTSGVAEIHVGSYTANQASEKKDRADDALGSVKAAIEGGVVAGGGVMYYYLAKDLSDGVLKDSLEAPLDRLMESFGVDTIDLDQDDYNYCFNFSTGEYGDALEMGVIDPVNVLKSALRNAASAASNIITCSCVIANEEENNVGGA